MRKPLAAGNWKMNLVREEAAGLVRELLSRIEPEAFEKAETALFPAFPLLPAVAPLLEGTAIRLGAQNVAWEEKGAFTGEVSAPMLRDAGCEMVIVGHSERRHVLGETDEMIRKRLHRALGSGLRPILCVGETLEERRAEKAFEVVHRQLAAAFEGLDASAAARTVVAYEPVWAIGTGENATPDQAQEMHAKIRQDLSGFAGSGNGASFRILYGGSVKPDNIRELMAAPDVDGVLVGGASLKAEAFARIVAEAAAAAR